MGKGLPVLLFVIFLHLPVRSQQQAFLKTLDSLIAADCFREVQSAIAAKVRKGDPGLNLGRLVYPLAKTEFLENNQTDFPLAQQLADELAKREGSDSLGYEASLGLGLAQLDRGQVLQANELIARALALARNLNDAKRQVTAAYYLGETGLKLGDFDQLIEYVDKALRIIRLHPNSQFQIAPRVYNYKASLMHFTARPDSADYYFEKAVQNIDANNDDPEYRYYLPAVIYGNWMLVKQTAGEYQEAMQLILKCISIYNTFLQKTHNHPLTEKVHGNLSIAYRNLGSLYTDLGDREKSIQVGTLGYNHAKKYLLPGTVQYFSALLMMGESHLYGENLQKARHYLTEAENSFRTIPGSNWSYAANLYSVLGDLEKKDGNGTQAIDYYLKTLDAYEKSSPDDFSQNVVYTRLNLAQAYAENNAFGEALGLLENTYAKIGATYGRQSYLAKAALLTQVRVYYLQGDYAKCISLCREMLQAAQGPSDPANDPYLWGEQAEVYLYLAKAQFGLLPHSRENLLEIAATIDAATVLVEKRKSLVTSQSGVASLIEANREVFNFAKKAYLALYRETQDEAHLAKVMALHESSIYNRIRARLNLAGDQFAPPTVREQENRLREQLNAFFDVRENDTQFDAARWDSLSTEWQSYLGRLQREHPAYYDMRYASIVEPLDDLKKSLGPNTTAVRYFSDGEALYAYVYHNGKATLVELGQQAPLCMGAISDYAVPEQELFECLYGLYQVLWKPLENRVPTENVLIFPDGDLFNLNFELLTPKKVASLGELATNSLLARHTFSYNYSLLTLDKKGEMRAFDGDFVAFAPEFDAEMKREYQLAIADSLNLDRAYLTLLPQPFSYELARKYGSVFDGDTFLNQNASKQLFSQKAKEHKIIHIGTHAESNNLSPELSRLVFAKNVSDSSRINDNSLYAFEIYNQNLSSNLAILTACETGKPAFQPGEGMVSLAHAFSYAGSESILTSLWQIDEKSSAEVLSFFYDYLAGGLPKDKALRLAKIDYLKRARGRTLHPQYWAGLVLMGDTSPIDLSKPVSWVWWALGLLALAAGGWLVYRIKKPL